MRGSVEATVAAVGLLGALSFADVVTFDFAYDDRWTIVENHFLERPLGVVAAALASGEAVLQRMPDATRPVMVLGHWVERRVFGLAPWGYHLDSLVLYAVVCGLAAQLAWLVSRRRDVALFAGCFFAVAPLHAEPVAAINYREDLYAAVGMLAALVWLFSAARTSLAPGGSARPRDSVGRALGIGLLFGFALLGKESALSFLPLLALVVWLVPWLQSPVRESRRALFALGTVFLLWLVWRVPLALHGDDLPLAPARPLLQTLLRTARFEVQAVRHALLPWSYLPDHWRQPDASFGWLAPFLSLVVGVGVLGSARATRLPALGVGIALVTPLGCCPLLRPINEYGDRYFFLGILGGGLVWGWLAGRVAERWALGRRRNWLALACAPLLVPTYSATQLWRNERTLWTAAVERTPESPRAWAALSRVHRIAGERDEADQASAQALARDPSYAPALVTAIYNDLAFGRLDEARERLAEMERRGYHAEGGLGKARGCARLDAIAAARCIGP